MITYRRYIAAFLVLTGALLVIAFLLEKDHHKFAYDLAIAGAGFAAAIAAGLTVVDRIMKRREQEEWSFVQRMALPQNFVDAQRRSEFRQRENMIGLKAREIFLTHIALFTTCVLVSCSEWSCANPGPTIRSIAVSCNPSILQLPIPGTSSPPTSQCTATVQGTGSFDISVTWQASAGGIGFSSGVFMPPSVAIQTAITITARSVQDTTKSGSTTVTVNPITGNCPPGGQPAIILSPPAAGAANLYGIACNVDPTKYKVVIYALTNEWYVQPLVASPFTSISSDGSWSTYTHGWSFIVALLVDPTNYVPAATEITNPAIDPNVVAWTIYPKVPISVNFSNYTWGIKMTGGSPSDQFDPGPNFWSPDPSVVSVAPDGLHLKITQINGVWWCGEVYLLKSLGYGIYTVQVGSHLDGLDQNTVAAPLFIYAAPGQELDNEYSGMGGLIPSPNDAQFVVQPYTVPGNLVRYVQPSTAVFTTQMEWRADHVTFTTWNGWAPTPAASDIIQQFTYTGGNIPPVGNERVRANLWLLNGAAPTNGTGDTMILHSFTFQP